MKEKPDRLYGDDANAYALLRETEGILRAAENGRIFILAMSMGFAKKSRKELKKGKEYIVRVEYLTDEEKSLIYALALAVTNDPKVLLDDRQVYTIAEEYANAGIKYLKELLISKVGADTSKKLVNELLVHTNSSKL